MLQRVLDLMKNLNINKNQLAKLCGLPRTTIYTALESEKNIQQIMVKTARAIVEALQTSFDFLVYGK